MRNDLQGIGVIEYLGSVDVVYEIAFVVSFTATYVAFDLWRGRK